MACPGRRSTRSSRRCAASATGSPPKAEAEKIKARLAQFLRETLGLELNPGKTLITHARTRRARFLGYGITITPLSLGATRSVRYT
jgi:hypothetical protein